jgi:hypothetical protein
MLKAAGLPEAFQFAADWTSPAVIRAAATPAGWVVAGAQHGVRGALAAFDRGLEPVRIRVVSSGAHCKWREVRPLALPEGRWLLSVAGFHPHNRALDLRTLEDADPPDWAACGGDNVAVAQLAVLKDRIVIGLGKDGRPARLMTMPAGARRAPAAFFEDFAEQLEATGNHFAGEASRFEAMAVVGDKLLLTHRYFMRSKPKGQALLAVGRNGKIAAQRDMRDKAERARFGDGMQWFADSRHKLALLYGGGVLEALDAQLASLARVDGHAVFRSVVPLAGDGGGGLLWHDARGRRLIATEPDDLDPRDLAGSLERIAGQLESIPSAKRAAHPARAKASPIARPALDIATLDTRYYRRDLTELLAVASGTADDAAHAFATARSSGMKIVASTTAITPDHPNLADCMRLLAQASAGDVSAHRPAGGVSQVSFPFGRRTVTRPADTTTVSPFEWTNAWYFATIVRDAASLDRLETMPDASFDPNAEAYRGALRAALIALRTKPAAARRLIAHCRELATPQNLRYSDDRSVRTWLREPLFPVLDALAARDQTAFQSALVNAVAGHRNYYSAPSRRLSEYGMIAWGPLALCCMARDAKLNFEADTKYLPRALL